MNADSLFHTAALYLTVQIGPATLSPFQTTLLAMAMAAVVVSGFNLWRIGGREERQARLAALRVRTSEAAPEIDNTRPPWYRRLGSVVAASPMIGSSERDRLLNLLIAAGLMGQGRVASLVAAKVSAGLALVAALWLALEWYQILVSVFSAYPILRVALLGAAFMLGWRLPDMVLSRLASRRRLSLEYGMPDAIDLLVVCAESGLSLNQAIEEVSRSLRPSHPVVAGEFAVTADEMRVQPDVEVVMDNMVQRTGIDSLRGLMATLKQSLRFGTPLAESLRLLAAEMRAMRQARMEERAARLPVLLAIPLAMFILPTLFIVILTPVGLRVLEAIGPMFGG